MIGLLLFLMLNASMTAALSSVSARTILISGATDGIGRHTAKKLAADGNNHLLVHGRKPDVGKDLCKELLDRGASSATYFNADLNDLEEVERLAEEVTEHCNANNKGSLDVLINNAGIFEPPQPAKSAQGFDQTFAVNVLAPFLLTRRLLPLVAASTDPNPRIITTSSISQSWSLPSMDELLDINNEPKSAHRAYSDSKLGDYLFTVRLAKILDAHTDERLSRIKCLTMDPGTVNTKMLLAGWGACGIPVSRADNTYKLATEYGTKQESGSYHFGGGGGKCDDIEEFWSRLEECTGCTYDDINKDL
mmetsp:Transcript_34001/g.100195  ORF Transcript_34001/g.100195 Transcript_34001/m.100195 type:complete len:306 (+) Transcript_34001:88-1005(+)